MVKLQFRSFSSVYFALIMCAQYFDLFAISPFLSSFVPWLFVCLLSLVNEGLDDYRRYLRDCESNAGLYSIWRNASFVKTTSSLLKVGDILLVEKGDRVPADCLLLKAEDNTGEVFIRTDQLDGETDWKRRAAPSETQKCHSDVLKNLVVTAELPHRGIYSFKGAIELSVVNDEIFDNSIFFNKGKSSSKDQISGSPVDGSVLESMPKAEASASGVSDLASASMPLSSAKIPEGDIGCTPAPSTCEPDRANEMVNSRKIRVPLDLDNTIWANTIVTTSSALCLIIYTGDDTRSMMNTYKPRFKACKIDSELDHYMLYLGVFSLIAAFFFTCLKIEDYTKKIISSCVIFIRFLILFSYVIPISLKVTINLARMCYTSMLQNDSQLKGAIVRLSSAQEELGRISFFLTDKTGTLTKNEMVMKKIHLGTTCYNSDNTSEIKQAVKSTMRMAASKSNSNDGGFRKAKTLEMRVFEMMEALALCHSVAPVVSEGELIYQASSPDEIAIVKYTELIGMRLIKRDRQIITLKTPIGKVTYRILQIFPFNSDTKRMGIIVQKMTSAVNTGTSQKSAASLSNMPSRISQQSEELESYEEHERNNNEILFFEKGADSAMKPILQEVEWAEEETDNMARDGLRTLLVGKKVLSPATYEQFVKNYAHAKLEIDDRSTKMLNVQKSLEQELELLGLTGVEDKLQDRVRPTLENLRNASMKVWMLTGDKIETAISIALSSRLLSKLDTYLVISNCETREEFSQHLQTLTSGRYNALIIDDISLTVAINSMLTEFIMIVRDLSCVVGCRCSPTQKAIMAEALRKVAGETVCCIGDGGNDVSMITEADVGVGIEGKEGNQASLAADFSLKNFADISDLLFWHGRRCYKNTSMIASIIIHRGMVIAAIQAIFCIMIYYIPISIFQGNMLVMFIIYTFAPFIAIIRAEDVSRQVVTKFPEIYKELRNSNLLSVKNLFIVNFNSYFQASAIMLCIFMFCNEIFAFTQMVFTCIVINEQALICLTIERINLEILGTCSLSLLLYMVICIYNSKYSGETFGLSDMLLVAFANICAISLKLGQRIYTKWIKPASYSKLGIIGN